MMFDFFLKYFLPPNGKATDGDVFRWRLFISLFVLAMGFHVAWVCGFVPGLSGVAFADDVEQKIDTRLKPIEEKLTKVSTGVDTLLKMEYSQSIRNEMQALCNTEDQRERDRINTTIERLQEAYIAVAGARYATPSCDAL